MVTDSLHQARAVRTPLERLGAAIPGFRGYLERELRREVDQLLRAEIAARIDSARQRVQAHARTLPLTAAARLGRVSSLEKGLDRLANSLRHLGSGYAGLFDAVKIREEQLETLYRSDLALLESGDALLAAADRLGRDEDALSELEVEADRLGAAMSARDAAVKSVVPA